MSISDVLQDYSKFKNFLSDEKEIQEIQKEAENERDYTPRLYYNRWQVCWITLNYPLDLLLESIFEMLADLFECFGCTKCHRFFKILSMHQMREWKYLKAQEKYGEKFLAPSTSLHQVTTCRFYGNEPIKKEEVQDAQVRRFAFDVTEQDVQESTESLSQPIRTDKKRILDCFRTMENGFYGVGLFNHRFNYIKVSDSVGFVWDVASHGGISVSGDNQAELLFNLLEEITDEHPARPISTSLLSHITHLPLYHPLGICRGASQWFMNLYLKTAHLFKDPRNHFVAICKQFQTGSSEKAALLQTLDDATISQQILGIKPLTYGRICMEKPDSKLANFVDFHRWALAENVVQVAEEAVG